MKIERQLEIEREKIHKYGDKEIEKEMTENKVHAAKDERYKGQGYVTAKFWHSKESSINRISSKLEGLFLDEQYKSKLI